MRVFVTLEDDLYRELQNQALRKGVSFHILLNEVLARGLQAEIPVTDGQARDGRDARGKKGSRAERGRQPTFDELLEGL